MIFEQLSLEYFLAGKSLPWNKTANQVIVDVFLGAKEHKGPVDPTAGHYFNLKNW